MTSAPAGGIAKAIVAKVSRGEKAARVRESMEPEKCRAELGGCGKSKLIEVKLTAGKLTKGNLTGRNFEKLKIKKE
jgi:hypothetical protein